MVRILGVNLKSNKPLFIGLQAIYGIGNFTAKKICGELSLPENTRVHQLTDVQISLIVKHISENYLVEGDLRRIIVDNVKRLCAIGSYRGLRHRRRLPCRGQRTHTNAKTCKRVHVV